MKITRKNIVNGKLHTQDIPLDPEDFARYELEPDKIDIFMPYLSDSHRDFILFGLNWNETVKEMQVDSCSV